MHNQQNNVSELHEAGGRESRFALVYMIAGAIAISIVLVVISMWLYGRSGAAQLDLSRPGYQEVRAKAQQTKQFDGFAGTGKLDEESLKQFDALYREQQKTIRNQSNGFSPAVLDNQHLEIHVE